MQGGGGREVRECLHGRECAQKAPFGLLASSTVREAASVVLAPARRYFVTWETNTLVFASVPSDSYSFPPGQLLFVQPSFLLGLLLRRARPPLVWPAFPGPVSSSRQQSCHVLSHTSPMKVGDSRGSTPASSSFSALSRPAHQFLWFKDHLYAVKSPSPTSAWTPL